MEEENQKKQQASVRKQLLPGLLFLVLSVIGLYRGLHNGERLGHYIDRGLGLVCLAFAVLCFWGIGYGKKAEKDQKK